MGHISSQNRKGSEGESRVARLIATPALQNHSRDAYFSKIAPQILSVLRTCIHTVKPSSRRKSHPLQHRYSPNQGRQDTFLFPNRSTRSSLGSCDRTYRFKMARDIGEIFYESSDEFFDVVGRRKT